MGTVVGWVDEVRVRERGKEWELVVCYGDGNHGNHGLKQKRWNCLRE